MYVYVSFCLLLLCKPWYGSLYCCIILCHEINFKKPFPLGKQIQKWDRNKYVGRWLVRLAVSGHACMCRGPNCVMLYFEQFALKFSHSPLFCFFYTNCRLAYSVISVLKKIYLICSQIFLCRICVIRLYMPCKAWRIYLQLL